MKVIDLLNKIANGEEVPEKFKFSGQTFEKQGSFIEDENGDSIFASICIDFSNINEEIEIIKYKKIEPIEYEVNKVIGLDTCIEKINEIIDRINNAN